MQKHLFFDLDNTLVLSRRALKPEHVAPFAALCKKADVIVVTGGTKEHIESQLGNSLGNYYMLAQSGNHAIDKTGVELWREQLDEDQVRESLRLIDLMKAYFAIAVKDAEDLVDNRGSQIGYSVIGYHEEASKKDAFDPDFSKRKKILVELQEDVARLSMTGIEVFPAGSSSYNFTPIGKDKGANVARFIEQEKWQSSECLYVGDALGVGENDHSVVGIIETKAVKGPADTFELIAKMVG